jgi:single-stranded DNA-binding protein
MHISQSLTQVVARLRDLVEKRPDERRSMMSSTRVALNRIVIVGRAVTEPVTRNVKSHHGETTLTVFSIRTAKDTYVGSVIMEIHAWSRAAAQAGHITKGRTVAVDGQLTQHEYLDGEGRKQTRTAIRADRPQLLDDSETRE